MDSVICFRIFEIFSNFDFSVLLYIFRIYLDNDNAMDVDSPKDGYYIYNILFLYSEWSGFTTVFNLFYFILKNSTRRSRIGFLLENPF